MKRRAYWLSEEDAACIHTLRARYGLSTDSDAVRMALRVLTANPTLPLEVPEPLKPGRKPLAIEES